MGIIVSRAIPVDTTVDNSSVYWYVNCKEKRLCRTTSRRKKPPSNSKSR